MSVTVEELQARADLIIKLREKKTEQEDTLSVLEASLKSAEIEFLAVLEAEGITEFKRGDYTLKKTEKSSVTMPQGDDKIEFFNYLKENNLFEAMAMVHATKLNSWYKAEQEAAALRGEPFLAIPGLGIPNKFAKLSVRQSKK
jgi:hypothetical protein